MTSGIAATSVDGRVQYVSTYVYLQNWRGIEGGKARTSPPMAVN